MILNAEQLACLASPIRNEAFSTLRKLGQASAREIAEEMGKSPEALHYHVRALLKAGLIEEKLRRPTSRKPEAVYETTAKTFRLPNLSHHPDLAPITRKAVAAGVRNALRGYEAAALRAMEDEALRTYLMVIRTTMQLSPQDAATFLDMIEAAVRFAREREVRHGVRLHWSSLVFPDSGR